MIRSVTCGTRNSEICATMKVEAFDTRLACRVIST
jgi:hypothetical protein